MDLIVLEYELNINALLDEYNNHYNINSFLFEDGPDTSSDDFSADINTNGAADTTDNSKPSKGNDGNKKGIIERIFEAISNFFSNIASFFKKTSVEGEAEQKLKLIEDTLREHPELRNRKITVPWYAKTPLKNTLDKITVGGKKDQSAEELAKLFWDDEKKEERTIGEVFDYVKSTLRNEDKTLKEALKVIEDSLYNKKADNPGLVANIANGFAKGQGKTFKLIPLILAGAGITYKLGSEHAKKGVVVGTATTVGWAAKKGAKAGLKKIDKALRGDPKARERERKRKEKERAKNGKQSLRKRAVSFVKGKFGGGPDTGDDDDSV